MIVFETELIARYDETDQMGIIHHSTYPVWFGVARSGFFKRIGMSYSKIEESGVMLPLSDLKCSFKSPARYDDEIIIKIKPVKFSCVRLTFQYEVFKKDGMILIVDGETSHAWTDKNLKPFNIEKKLPELYSLLKEAIKG